ncbi:hypothetical protein GJU40_02650 [Bacillus lacus]|uniref:Uncharacterized protein n=1 Tax=Metabacillus lacus TaxID=1983721 RepID=A0A7X2IXS2_9BACI|nr:DUF6241 domain-containing protein [Metabacillus lacus]MRX71068.1 hypothetical protein [Metabacillus lacus]
MSESAVQSAIYALSHQKVAAQDKWSHLLITPERISRLIEVVEHNKDNFQHTNLYLDILYSWRDGDYSNSVKAHNDIWALQSGTIGIATSLLTPEEEQQYIEQHFE